eukprot:11219595-Lingulodinium_polyedra.AAC.1
MGFAVEHITRALEQTQFSFGRALLLLLNGVDDQRAKYDTQERVRRRSQKIVKTIDCNKLA